MMKYHVQLSPDEDKLLQDYFKYSPFKLVRSKALAIRMRSQGYTFEQIGQILVKKKRTVRRWIKNFTEIRMASIFTGHANNENASKLTKEQKTEVKVALESPPSKFGIPREFWNVPRLRTYVEAIFGVVYESLKSYHLLLRFSNLSFKYPDTFSIRRDDESIKTRMKKICEEIEPLLEDPEWEVFAADEARMVLEAETRRAWLRKGKRTVIKVKQSKEYQSYFGALNQKTYKCHVFELNWQNQEEIIAALTKLLEEYPDKKICIVWDNVSFHKGKLIREALAKGKVLERVHLINFPPYAPDHNPIEQVWNTVKANLANKQFDSFDITKALFKNEIDSRTFEYKITS